jgi:hypothetical protein
MKAALMRKVLGHVEGLKERPSARVLVMESTTVGAADALVTALKASGIPSSLVRADKLEDGITGAAAVFFVSGTVTPVLSALCAKHQVLSVSDQAVSAEDGSVTLALARKSDGKPEIVINLPRSKAEGQVLSTQLLGLARVIE